MRRISLLLPPLVLFLVAVGRCSAGLGGRMVLRRQLSAAQSAPVSQRPARWDQIVNIAAVPFNIVGKSAKIAVSSTAGMAVLLSPSWLPLYYITGALLNALTSKIIKRVVRQPRPPTSKKGGYGMPSSHAHLLFYFLTISSLLSRKHYPSYLSLAVALSLGMYAVSASYWRVVDGLHTGSQTLIGAALGVGMGTLFHIRQNAILASLLSPALQREPVPLPLKIGVLTFGALTLYMKEIKAYSAKNKNK